MTRQKRISGPQTPDGDARASRHRARHDRRIAGSTRFIRAVSAAGREIGTIPPVRNPRRRKAAAMSFRLFAETYCAAAFPLAWSADHLRVIDRIERAVLHGELFAFAMPRATGKTTLVTMAALWALLYGHRDYVAIVGADEGQARRMLDSIWQELEINDQLLDDFPEVCHPIRALERISQRMRGQLHDGKPTRMSRTRSEVTLPTIAGSKASGARLQAAGITGAIRGMSAKRSDGTQFRPSLVLIDDPATDETANSPAQVQTRLEILRGAILGLAGPERRIAGLCTLTVIRPGDLADQLLDRTQNPAWQGERAKLVYQWPTAESLWQQYAELRRDGQRTGAGTQAATDFYAANREAMDAGSRVGWAERHNDDELSALQHAYNLRIDRGEAAFFAEYQNEPLSQKLETAGIDAAALHERSINVERGIVPTAHNTLTAAIDVQERLLYWSVMSWGPQFSGHVVAYGTLPDQTTTVFTAAGAKRTLADRFPGRGFEAALLAGLTELSDMLLLRDWKREDGGTMRIDRLVVDANWGQSTNTVREFARRHQLAALILPAHGRGVGAASKPFHEHTKKRGELVGPGWRIGDVGGQRGLLFDANHVKTFLAERLKTPVGDPGAVTWHSGRHDMLIDHLTAEHPIAVTARGRTVDEWRLLPARENHLLDTATMNTVAASIAGVTAVGAEPLRRQRRKVAIPKTGERRTIQVRRFGA
jgi:hypothetical protein